MHARFVSSATITVCKEYGIGRRTFRYRSIIGFGGECSDHRNVCLCHHNVLVLRGDLKNICNLKCSLKLRCAVVQFGTENKA